MEFLLFLLIILFQVWVITLLIFGGLTYLAVEVVITVVDLEYEIRKWNRGLSPINEPWLQTDTINKTYWKTVLFVDSSGNYFWSRFPLVHKIFKPKLKI